MGRRSLPPHTRVVRVRSVPTAGSRAGSQFPSPGHGPGLSVLNKSTYQLKITGIGTRAVPKVSSRSGHGPR